MDKNSPTLVGFQRKFLRGLAHPLKPLILIGQNGAGLPVVKALDEALTSHELVKVKFLEGKEKTAKKVTAEDLRVKTNAHLVGMIGHIAIFYRPHPQIQKRKIVLPQPPSQ